MKKRIIKIIVLTLIISFSVFSINSSATTVKLNKKVLKVQKGKTRKLKVSGTTKRVVWKSKNSKIAKLDEHGRARGVKVGETKIIAKVGKKKYVCTVKVKKIYIASAREALRYVLKFLKKNKMYVPKHVGFHESIYGDKGYKIHGYDDMGTHIVTSFWYSVSHDGKIYDESLLKYVKK